MKIFECHYNDTGRHGILYMPARDAETARLYAQDLINREFRNTDYPPDSDDPWYIQPYTLPVVTHVYLYLVGELQGVYNEERN